jgi:hypothetical protein
MPTTTILLPGELRDQLLDRLHNLAGYLSYLSTSIDKGELDEAQFVGMGPYLQAALDCLDEDNLEALPYEGQLRLHLWQYYLRLCSANHPRGPIGVIHHLSRSVAKLSSQVKDQWEDLLDGKV